MAHADYDCCAVCDCKMSYNGGMAETKKEICSHCVAELATRGVIVHGVDKLMEWMRNTDLRKVKRILKECNFRVCFYIGEIDELLAERTGYEWNQLNAFLKGE